MARYECTVCGYIYDEAKEGKKWDELPDDWVCPLCGSGKSYFKLVEGEAEAEAERPGAESVESEKVDTAGEKGLRCSVCGYVMDGGYTGEECPVCGALRAAFESYTDRVSSKRRKFLNLHLHSVVVHFPQAFSVFMLFSVVMLFILKGQLKADFWATLKVLSMFLPVSVVVGLVSGMMDGRVRFRRLSTIILRRKIMAALVFLVFSVGVFVMMNCVELSASWHVVLVGLNGVCALSSVFLGHNGGRLVGMETPG